MTAVVYKHYAYYTYADGTRKRYTTTQTRYIKTGIRKPHGIPIDEEKQLEFYNKWKAGEQLKKLCPEYNTSYYFARQIIKKYEPPIEATNEV